MPGLLKWCGRRFEGEGGDRHQTVLRQVNDIFALIKDDRLSDEIIERGCCPACSAWRWNWLPSRTSMTRSNRWQAGAGVEFEEAWMSVRRQSARLAWPIRATPLPISKAGSTPKKPEAVVLTLRLCNAVHGEAAASPRWRRASSNGPSKPCWGLPRAVGRAPRSGSRDPGQRVAPVGSVSAMARHSWRVGRGRRLHSTNVALTSLLGTVGDHAQQAADLACARHRRGADRAAVAGTG